MSTNGIEAVLSRAMSDNTFANQLFANPDQALVGFELTAEEAATFKGLSRAEFSSLISLPEERKSMSVSRKAGEQPKE